MNTDRVPFVEAELTFIPVPACDVICTSDSGSGGHGGGFIDFDPMPIPRP